MYWSNYHSHSTFSDGRIHMEAFVKFAIAKGVKRYGFSSHAPLPFLTMWTMKEDDFHDYQAEFIRLKLKYEGQIELFLGLEIDYIHHYSSVDNDFFKNIKLDYSIGSIHYADKIPNGRFWNIDGDLKVFDNGLMKIFDGDIKAAVKRYLSVSTLMIEKGGFDIVGHIDKISANASTYRDFNVSDKWYMDMIGEILQLVKQKGFMLEINTKSLLDRGMTFPHQQHYALINELNIPIMVNSDCHMPTCITDGFTPTYKALKLAGFKTMQQIINGKWEAVAFDENGLKE